MGNSVETCKETTLADRFRQARETAGLRQVELAQKLGVTQQAIANIEAGTRRGGRLMQKAARVLMVSRDYLETGEGEPHISIGDPFLDQMIRLNPAGFRRANELYARLLSLSPEQQNAVLSMLKAFDRKSSPS